MGFLSQKGFGIKKEEWIRKGLKQVLTNPFVFLTYDEEKSRIETGMGNREIKVLKDWLIAAGLVLKIRGKQIPMLTNLGKVIAKYDIELSENGTFWAIHNSFSQDTDKLLFYYWYVNEFDLSTFKREDLQNLLSQYIHTTPGNIEGHCISPLITTMRKTRLGKTFGIMIEDSPNQFRRIEPPEDVLDPIIVAYITMDWAKRNERSTANLTELTTSKCSPGKILHLTIQRYSEYLDKIQEMFNKEILWVSYTAGLNSVSFERNVNPLDILKAYYIKKRDEISTLQAYRKAKEEIV